MMCGGCEKAVTAMLKKVEGTIRHVCTPGLLTDLIYSGVENVTATHADNRVVVEGSASPDTMLAAIQKTGKKCSLAQ